MTNIEIIEVLRANKIYLQQNFGVERIGLYGSFARGEQKVDSDIDILVKFKTPTYNAWYSVVTFLENNLESKVDLISEGTHLSDRFRNRVSKEIIYA